MNQRPPDQNITEMINEPHMNHCIHALRESVMCHSDISTNVWIRDGAGDGTSASIKPSQRTLHSCRNFRRVKDWAETKRVDSFELLDRELMEGSLDIPTWPQSVK